MNKSQKTIVALFAVLGILLLIYFLWINTGEKSHQWYESYRADSDQPYGTLFVKKMLAGYRPDGHFIFNDKKSLADVLPGIKSKTDYVFIGQSLYLSVDDEDALLKFVMSGNDAIIASLEPPETMLEKFFPYECGYKITYHANDSDSVDLHFYHDTLQTKEHNRYAYRYGSKDEMYSWQYMANGIFCDSTKSVVPLGFQEPNRVNFLRLSYGSGNLYLHSNPLVFTNYFLLKPDKVDYAAVVFSHLRGKDVIWDEYSKVPMTGNKNAYNSPLYYILQQPNLKYAWWLLLATVLLYVFFAIKRTQRVIPILEIKTNTSLEFIQQVSALHFQNGDHLDMARKKMKYFFYFIRSKYGIQRKATFNEVQVLELAEKSKVNEADVRTIFRQYEIIEHNSTYNIPAYRLVDLYYAIDNFYKNCK